MGTLFGYTLVEPKDIGGLCHCGDPGNYVMFEERGIDPLDFTIRCWCGRTKDGRFDDVIERAATIAKYGQRA